MNLSLMATISDLFNEKLYKNGSVVNFVWENSNSGVSDSIPAKGKCTQTQKACDFNSIL